MIRALPAQVQTLGDEAGASVVAVLEEPGQKAVLRTALALTSGRGNQVAAWCWARPGDALSLQHRIAVYGLAPRTEADRVIHGLVREATRGAHVCVRPFSADNEARSLEIEGIHALGSSCLLVTAGSSGSSPALRSRRNRVVGPHPGPLVVTTGGGGAPFSTVLSVTIEAESGRGASAASTPTSSDSCHQAIVETLSFAYPLYSRRLPWDALTPVLEDAGDDVLVLLHPQQDAPLDEELWTTVRGTADGEIVVLLPEPGVQRDRVLELL